MFGYSVDISSYCTHSHHSEEEYGDWSSSYDNTFLKVAKTDIHPDVVSVLDIGSGENCFVVWAEWGSGDSFGHADSSNVEALAIFTNEGVAQEFVRILDEGSEYTHEFSTSDGQHHRVHKGWVGHFETLDGIHIESCVMNKE